MPHYYLDLETFGHGDAPDPKKDAIIAAMWCPFDPETGTPLQRPTVVTEKSEREIVTMLAARMLGKPFDFIPVGFGTLFDLWFLRHKFNALLGHDLDDRWYLERPFIDLKHVAVLANKGRFKGVSLVGDGAKVHAWHAAGDTAAIATHLHEKHERCMEAYRAWYAILNRQQGS